MRYKGEYAPSYLLDPEEYTWHSLEECKPVLDQVRYASFAHPELNVKGAYTGSSE
jgi:arginine-tRNA-protein transferase